jgi:shikimate dehydrogenase
VPVVTRRCAVLGRPITHSLSPVLHRTAYAELGLDWRYDAREVGQSELAAFLDGLDDSWRGLSLTMPLKRMVVPLLDGLSDRARRAGAVNTVLLDDGRRWGDNTDIPGAVAAVRERTDVDLGSAVVLGGGATAASMMLALADLGCPSVRLVVREPERAADTLTAVGRHPSRPTVEVLTFGELEEDGARSRADIVVSTVPAAAQSDEVLTLARTAPVVFDVVYDPWPTPLAAAAVASGATLVSGLDLLVHQAALQVELMTGVAQAPVAAMRAAGERALG